MPEDNAIVYPSRIRVGADVQDCSANFQIMAEYASAWQSALRRAHPKYEMECLCPGHGEKRLSIHYTSDTDKYCIHRYSNTGHEHAYDCCRYAPDPEKSGIGGYDDGVVEYLPEGIIRIKTLIGLKVHVPGKEQIEQGAVNYGTRTTRQAISPIGLLHLLWSEARLSVWHPKMDGERDDKRVMYWLRKAACSIRSGRIYISDVLCLAAFNENSKQAKRNAEIVKNATRKKNRLVVIAPLASFTEERARCEKGRLPIIGFHGIPYLVLDANLWRNTANRFSQEMSAWELGHRIIAIAQVDTPKGQRAEVIDLALMMVSEQWVPVDSMLEHIVENRLRVELRFFEKPLMFDAAGNAAIPSFWLKDAVSEYPMVVFGRDDAERLGRKQKHIRHYDQKYGHGRWWAWDASVDQNADRMPVFPPKDV